MNESCLMVKKITQNMIIFQSQIQK